MNDDDYTENRSKFQKMFDSLMLKLMDENVPAYLIFNFMIEQLVIASICGEIKQEKLFEKIKELWEVLEGDINKITRVIKKEYPDLFHE